MVDFLQSYTFEKNFKHLKVSIALQCFHETVNFFFIGFLKLLDFNRWIHLSSCVFIYI